MTQIRNLVAGMLVMVLLSVTFLVTGLGQRQHPTSNQIEQTQIQVANVAPAVEHQIQEANIAPADVVPVTRSGVSNLTALTETQHTLPRPGSRPLKLIILNTGASITHDLQPPLMTLRC